MLPATDLPAPHDLRAVRRRAVALAVVLVVHLLLVALLIVAGRVRVPGLPEVHSMILVAVAEPQREPPARRRTERAKPQESRPPTGRVVAPEPIVPPPPRLPTLHGLIPGLETFDLAQVAPTPPEPKPAEATADASPGAETGPAYGPTLGRAGRGMTGPRGEPLYPAEWVREPSHAELATYLPAVVPQDAYALIACRTVAGFRVEDCTELDQSPPGSGLSRAIRLAAWQFRVRPPRVGGNLEVGAWVSIRIDFTESGEAVR